MKKIYLLLGFVVCALASCLEDKGNELYIEFISADIINTCWGLEIGRAHV